MWRTIEDGEVVEEQWVTDLRESKQELKKTLLGKFRGVFVLITGYDGGDADGE